ncbi:MAG: T9SS type A sorting domain-containing protein [Ignavibacteriaceae bacterium]|nr:T9SS type A sorting domain-containing protein [Ignavibacteriaceae bacterium]
MKKLLIILFYIILFGVSINAQITQNKPGKDYFPHIGFFDFMVQYLHVPNNLSGSAAIENSVNRQGYYHQALKALGLTNLVTDWKEYNRVFTNPTGNNQYYINDMGIEWYSNPANKFLKSFGHDKENYTLVFGGGTVGDIGEDKNFGFQKSILPSSSYWCMSNAQTLNNVHIRSGNTITGSYYPETNPTEKYVRYANVNIDQEGCLVWGEVPASQFYFTKAYHIEIEFKVSNFNGNPNDTLFTIHTYNPQPPVFPVPIIPRPSFYEEEEDPDLANKLYLPFSVRFQDINLVDDYDSYTTGRFTIEKASGIGFYVVWHKKSDLYIESITIYDEDFMNNVLPRNTGPSMQALENRYGSSANSLLQNIYLDEPFMLTSKARGILQNEIKSNTTLDYLEVNGATGIYPDYFLRFDHEYAIDKSSLNPHYKDYVLYNLYPFGEAVTISQEDVQASLDYMVKGSFWGYGHDNYEYDDIGLVAAQRQAQRYGEKSDAEHLPLFMTLQVHAEHQLAPDTFVFQQNAAAGKRPPTKDEIFAMGNISIAHGVKGFMYYMIPTRSEIRGNSVHNPPWGTYGLFDAAGQGNVAYKWNYASSTPTAAGLWQDPAALQVPNNRYDAVQEFITDISQLENTLLRLKWLVYSSWKLNSAVPMDSPPVLDYKSSLTGDFENNPDDTVFVHLGYFEEYAHIPDYNEDAKYIYVVNRRCNVNNSDRYIQLQFNSDYLWQHFNGRNISVVDVKKDSTASLPYPYKYTLFLKAGHGTLLKIIPTIQVGGDITINETVPAGTYNLRENLVVKNGAELTLSPGVKLNFENSSKLEVKDNSKLIANGTSGQKVEFDFISKNWTEGNGIASYNSTLSLNHVVIKNASCGIYSHISKGDELDYVEITNTYTGISLYYSYNNGEEKTRISNSTIENAQLWGITMVASKPFLSENRIINNPGIGINALKGSEPTLLNEGLTYGGNYFLNNSTSIKAVNSSPLLSDYGDSYGLNCFTNDTVSLHTIVEDPRIDLEIYAKGNYWGASDPQDFRILTEGEGSVTINTFNYLPDCGHLFTTGITANKGGSNNSLTAGIEETDSIKLLLNSIRLLVKEDRLREAQSILNGIIMGEVEEKYKKMAIKLLPSCYKSENLTELTTYLLEIRNHGEIFKPVTMLLMNIDTENKEIYTDEILNPGSNKMTQSSGQTEEIMVKFNLLLEEKVKITGEIDTLGVINPLLAYFNNNFPESEYTLLANLIFSDIDALYSNQGNKPLSGGSVQNIEEAQVIKEYKLYNNYPNPFNPTTAVKFSIKEKSNISLEVFNITGQKIMNIVSGEKEEGLYEYTFDGSKLSSGVYIIRLTAQSLINAGTYYTNTIKTMLLK